MNKIEKLNSNVVSYGREHGFISVVVALAGNFVIASLKVIGFLLYGSSSLFSEMIHSLADTVQLILFAVKHTDIEINLV